MAQPKFMQTKKGPTDSIAEIWELVRDYAKQETIDPLRNVGRFLGYGIGGTILVGLGVFFLSLAALRALQEETTVFHGAWSFSPYLIVGVGLLVVTALAGLAATRSTDKDHP